MRDDLRPGLEYAVKKGLTTQETEFVLCVLKHKGTANREVVSNELSCMRQRTVQLVHKLKAKGVIVENSSREFSLA